MKKNLSVILTAFLVLSFFGLDFLGSIHLLEPVNAGEELEMHVNVNNGLDKKFEGVTVQAYFLDMGDIMISRPFTLDNFENNGFLMHMPIPASTPKGDYTVKIIASSEDIYDSKHVYFTVR